MIAIIEYVMYLQDAIEAKREQLTQNNETIYENNMFLDVVGGKQKGRVYGLGSQATQYYNFGSTSSSTSAFDVSQQNTEVIQQLQHRINDQDLMIRDLREMTQLLLRRLDEMSKGGQVLVSYNQPSHDHGNEHQTFSDDHTSDNANLSPQ